MSKQDDKQAKANDSQEGEVDEQFQSEAVAAFVEAVRDAWKQARKDKKLAKADLVEVLGPQLAELDRAVSESTTKLQGKVRDVVRNADMVSQQLRESKDQLRRERERLPTKAKEEFASEMLRVADALDGAAKSLDAVQSGDRSRYRRRWYRRRKCHSRKSLDAILAGVHSTARLMGNALRSQGFEKIDPLHSDYDTHLHEAMGNVESSEHSEGTVIAVVQSGYINETTDFLLRPARVVVAAQPTKDAHDDGETANAETESDMTNDDAANTINPQTKPANE